MEKYISAYYAYIKKYGIEPNVMILDDIRKHHEFIYEMRWSKTFLGCEIYVAANANFGFEFHYDRDLQQMVGKTIDESCRIVRIQRQRLDHSLSYISDPCDPMIPVSIINEIIETDREALEAFKRGQKWEGVL